jgi:two-component system, OmpR family, alkaline phosphatase synthesis response regulator PhoP
LYEKEFLVQPNGGEAAGRRMKSAKILIVDDDLDFIEISRLNLEAKGYQVLSASSGKEGWKMAEKEKPDLIILDLMMEKLDAGMALSQKIKADPRLSSTPILMLTSISRDTGMDFAPRTAEELEKLKVDDFHTKPIKGKTLLEKVEKLLERAGKPANP